MAHISGYRMYFNIHNKTGALSLELDGLNTPFTINGLDAASFAAAVSLLGSSNIEFDPATGWFTATDTDDASNSPSNFLAANTKNK